MLPLNFQNYACSLSLSLARLLLRSALSALCFRRPLRLLLPPSPPPLPTSGWLSSAAAATPRQQRLCWPLFPMSGRSLPPPFAASAPLLSAAPANVACILTVNSSHLTNRGPRCARIFPPRSRTFIFDERTGPRLPPLPCPRRIRRNPPLLSLINGPFQQTSELLRDVTRGSCIGVLKLRSSVAGNAPSKSGRLFGHNAT